MEDRVQPMSHQPVPASVIIWYDEAPERKPPATEVGVIGWLRANLFGSLADTILTVMFGLVVGYLAWGWLNWAIADADWNVITRNLRLFLSGRYPLPEMGRVRLVLLLLVFLGGLTWRLLGRASRRVAILTIGLLLVLYVVPVLTQPIHYPPTYFYANAASERGDFTNVVFLLEAEKELPLRLFPADPQAGIMVGFSDVVSATEAGQAEQAVDLYAVQLARSQTDLTIAPPAPLPAADVSVTVQVFDADWQVIQSLSAAYPETIDLTFTVPATGWYVLRIDPSGVAGAYWLALDEYAVFLSGENILAPLVESYGPIPQIEGERVESANSEFLRFRGSRTLAQYLRLQLTPLLVAIRGAALLTTVILITGYLVGLGLSRLAQAQLILRWLWVLSLLLTIALLRGIRHDEYLALARLITSLALALPVLYGYFNSSLLAREHRERYLRLGLLLVVLGAFGHYFGGIHLERHTQNPLLDNLVNGLGALLNHLPTPTFWPSLLIAGPGLLLLGYALDENNRRTLLRWLAVGLGIAGGYCLIALFIMESPLQNTPLEGTFLAKIPPFSVSYEDRLTFVPTDRWGGLILTLALAAASITASFPIGVLLALGRRSELPVIHLFSIGAIEFVRGVPLVTILFMSSIMVPLLSPKLAEVDNVVRAMVGMTFFSAAYVAEVVRGGLQAIPYGQTEAAKAVGMSGWQITLYIILPQALRAVIPALVGQFISLFKDTSLVFIIGLIEILGVSRTVINQAEYIGTQLEALIFIGIIYFIGAYAMSYTSRRIEKTGSGVARRL